MDEPPPLGYCQHCDKFMGQDVGCFELSPWRPAQDDWPGGYMCTRHWYGRI